MKTFKFLLMFVVMIGLVATVNAVVVENPDFEGDGLAADEYQDNTTPTGWTWNGSESRGIGVGDGNHFLWQGNAAYTYQVTDQLISAEGTSFTLSVDVRDDWESYPKISLFYLDGETHVELASAAGTGTNTWETVELTATATAASVGSYLGIALSQADESGWSHFDNVVLVNNIVVLDSPENGASQVAVNSPIQWSTAPEIEMVDVFIGTENDPNLTLKPAYKVLDNEPAATTSYSPTMDFSTTYYWKVIGYEPNEVAGATDYLPVESDVYSFTTAGPAPIITAITPYAQSVEGDVSEDPTITVTGANLETFVWSKDGTDLTDTNKYGGLGSSTLVINNMTLTDEGVYTCVASNSLSEETDSASAVVVTKRLMSWWKLDGDLDDSVQVEVSGATKYDGVVDANTVFTTDGSGIDGGNSLVFDIDDPNYQPITIPDTAEMFNFYEDELTVSSWIRTSFISSSSWPAVLSKTADGGDGYFVAFDGESQIVTELDSTRLYSNYPVVADGQWHMITLTYDGTAQKIYVDGELVASSATSSVDASENVTDVIIGAWNASSDSADFDGNIDDVKIYSYAMTTEQVGLAYIEMNDAVDFVCDLEASDLSYDYNNNCKVDLADFAAFASTWLECNRIPASACSLE